MSIQFSSDRPVATVTINRPEKLNALSYGMIGQLMDVLDEVEAGSAIRAVILTGAAAMPSARRGHRRPRHQHRGRCGPGAP